MSVSQAKPKIVVILGPTASGKSDLAVGLASRLNGEIVSADSRQVYKGLDIGSGKVTPDEMKGMPHHLLSIVSPTRVFTASDFARIASKSVRDILNRSKLPIICGGTGFYIDAFLHGDFFTSSPPNPKLRKELDKLKTEELAKKLADLDPERYASIDVKNRVRLIRALEIILHTGKPVPKRTAPSKYDALKLGVLWPKDELDRRIEIRLDRRLDSGMIEEVRRLKFPEKGRGLSWKRLYNLGLEYRFISLYLRGELSYEKMRDKLLTAIRQYAKRQMTWFKKDKEIIWLKPSELEKAFELTEKFVKK